MDCRGANPDDSALKVAVKYAQAAGQLFVTAAGEFSKTHVLLPFTHAQGLRGLMTLVKRIPGGA